jgi:hypothetical protein
LRGPMKVVPTIFVHTLIVVYVLFILFIYNFLSTDVPMFQCSNVQTSSRPHPLASTLFIDGGSSNAHCEHPAVGSQ